MYSTYIVYIEIFFLSPELVPCDRLLCDEEPEHTVDDEQEQHDDEDHLLEEQCSEQHHSDDCIVQRTL